MEKLLSNKKVHEKIFIKGFAYLHEKTVSSTKYYVCERYYQPSRCKGRLIIKNADDVKESKPHSHLPDARLLPKSIEITKLKHKAKTSNQTPRDLVAQACASMDIDIAPMLPTTRSMTRLVSNLQRQNTDMKNPKTLADLIFSPESVTINGRNFLLYDSAISDPNSDRIVIFGTRENLRLLALCSTIAMDGTFKITPPLFHQLYTIHGLYKGHWLPLIYVLCPNKAQKTYERILNVLKHTQPDLKPLDVIVDFERAMINALHTVFKETSVHGCFFHFCQNIWRHVQEVGLQTKYAEDINFSLNIRMLMALALIPTDNVVKAFETLLESPFWEDRPTNEFNKEKQALLNYFEYTYIGKQGRTSNLRRHAPLFSIALWNMYQVTLDGLPRTNNCVEGWHNRISSFVGCSHPKMFKFLDKIKKEQALQETNISQIDAGMDLNRKNKKNLNLKSRMLNVVKMYKETETLNYLKNIGQNIHL